MKSSQTNILTFLSIIFFGQACLSMTFPLLTLIMFDNQSRLFAPDTSHAVRSMWYGVCISIPTFLAIFFTPLLSFLSDAFGRRKILLIEIFSAMLFTLTAAMGVIYGILGLIIVALSIQGALTGARVNPSASAIMADLSPKQNKVVYMGYLQFAISIGAFIGPIIAGFYARRFLFSELNFSVPYFFAAAFACVGGLLTWGFFHETLNLSAVSVREHLSIHALRRLLANPNIVRISVILLLSQISWSMYYQLMPPILKTLYHFDPRQLGLFVGFIALWLALATGIGIKLLMRFLTLRQLLLLSLYLILLGLVLTFLACLQGAWLAWIAAMPIATGDVITFSCVTALYSDSVDPQSRGKIMGIGLIIVSLIWSLTGFIGGTVLAYSPLLPIIIAPIGVITAIILVHNEFGKRLIIA